MSEVASKKQKIPNVPNLRFTKTDFRICRLFDVAEYGTSRYSAKKEEYISTENLRQNFEGFNPYSGVETINGTEFFAGDTLIGNIRPYLKKTYLADFHGCSSADVLVLHPRSTNSSYLYYLISNDRFFGYVMETAKGSKMPRGDKKWILSKLVAIPSSEEQQRVSNLLTLLDQRIAVQNKIIKDLETLRKSIIDRHFSKESNFVPLKKVLSERKTFSEKGLSYEHVTLSKDGIIPKGERYDRDFLVKDGAKEYKITKLNDICYNPANLKFGVICLNSYGDAIFSPIYVTFEVNKRFDPYFVSLYLTSNRFIKYILRYQQGTVYERMAVCPEDLLKGKLPSGEKDKSLGSLTKTIDKKIDLEKSFLRKCIVQKEYLLENMFI